MHAVITPAKAAPTQVDESQDASEVVSPELVLVDPTLRERALRELPERYPIWPEPTTFRARPAATPAVQAEAPRPARRRQRPRPGAYLIVPPLIVLAVLLGPKLWRNSSSSSPSGPPEARHSQVAPTRTAPRKQAPASPVRTASTPAAIQGRNGCALLAWEPAAEAAFYDVVLWRNGTRILDLYPKTARAQLNERWTYRGATGHLRPGRYLWFVYPGFQRARARRFGPLRAHGAVVVRAGTSPCARRVRVRTEAGASR